MDIEEKFRIIEGYFTRLDAQRKATGKPLHEGTAHGIWGPTHMLDAYELFLRMRLDGRGPFVDLGSGDGRIALLAALFTESCGFEGDKSLSAIADQAKRALQGRMPELGRCVLVHGDYATADLSRFGVLFTFADHPWDPGFEKMLAERCRGVLLSYNNIFLPKTLPKGRTYWIQQIPIVSYHLNVPEGDLFSRA
jgi:hypothetical protein